MSETRWTAPWSVAVEPDREWVLDANGHIVCALTMERGVSLPRARLIAAAPDLAAALRLLLADVQDYETWQRPCHAVDVARAALAKARGE